jgi:hypothetical protein
VSIISDMIGPLILIVGLGFVALILPIWNGSRKIAARDTLNKSDFVVFETEPSELLLLQADFRQIGWTLSDTSPSDGGASFYRFERESRNAAKWGDISLDFDKYMPMTSSRQSLTVIKIKDHGQKL